MSITYRAVYWISSDRQSDVRLTNESQAQLADSELIAAATEAAEEIGLEIGDGSIEIGDWTE